IERLDPEAVAREQEPSVRLVPERDREHPAQVLDEALAVLLVEVRHELDVADTAKRVPLRLEVGAELAIVVELAVDDGDDVAALVRDRLVTGLQVDDREPPHREPRALSEPATVPVRPAMT